MCPARIFSVLPERLLGEPAPSEILVRPPTDDADATDKREGRGSLAEKVLREGLSALPHGNGALSEILLPPSPSLDDLLAGYLCRQILSQDPGRAPIASEKELHRLAEYAAQVREGILPGSLVPQETLGGVYLAILELHRGQQTLLLERGLRLVAAGLVALRSGWDPRKMPFDAGDFGREQAYLEEDGHRYERDREAGRAYKVKVGTLWVSLLWLTQPTSILFQPLAFRDKVKTQSGFDILVVERRAQGDPGRTHFALVANPTRRLALQHHLPELAKRLSEQEGEAWYGGDHHGFLRLASPRRGSALERRVVEVQILKAFQASPLQKGTRPGMQKVALWAFPLLPLVAGAGYLFSHLFSHSSRRPVDREGVRGDWQKHRLPEGEIMPEAERTELRSGKVRNYALLIAASEYAPREQGGLGPLRTPWRDACALRHLLKTRFGYRSEDITVLSDSPCLSNVAGPPTRQQLFLTIEKLPIRKEDTLLFYYAGHGAIEDEPGGRYGYLQPGGWERRGLAREDRGLRMRVLAEHLRDKVAARHQLLLIDACHSGEAAVVRGSDDAHLKFAAPAHAGWADRAVYSVITAGGTADLALEERLLDSPFPHSLFVRGILEALAPSQGTCKLRADVDPAGGDGLVSDGELFKYLAVRVPQLRASIEVPGLPEEDQRQIPEWNPWAAVPRGGGNLRIGEFLFVPGSSSQQPCGEYLPKPAEPAEPDECRKCPSSQPK